MLKTDVQTALETPVSKSAAVVAAVASEGAPAEPAAAAAGPARLLADAEAIMQKYMAGYDPSHDELHVQRVRHTARRLAESIPGCDVTVVELGALFHDLIDHKYLTSAEEREKRLEELRDVMARNGLEPARASTVLKIVENTGFSVEKKLRKQGLWGAWHEETSEFHCVQDADRLDAIGAMGIFRVAAYAERSGAPLFHPDPAVASAYQHFFDKLLTLHESLRTPLARRAGERRYQLMKEFVKCARDEYDLVDL